MPDYRFVLEPFKLAADHHRQQKHICPNCGMRTLVRYIDKENGDEYLDESVGRCDREDNCGYHKTPKEWFRETGKYAANGNSPYVKVRQKNPVQELPPSLISYEEVRTSLNLADRSNFYKWLASRFDPGKVEKVAKWYRLGFSDSVWKGACIFWQFDINKNIRTGKIMQYDIETGHRIKKDENGNDSKILYYHRTLHDVKRRENFNLVQCFFGEHLLNYAKGKICIVESEKTAMIASICVRGATWLATGGIQNLSEKRCRILDCFSKNQIILFPDLKAEDKWLEKAAEIPQLKNALVSNWLYNQSTREDYEKGLDIGDYLVEHADGGARIEKYLRTLPDFVPEEALGPVGDFDDTTY